MTDLGASAESLLATANEVFAGTRHDSHVQQLQDRFHEPLRVAIAGKVKAGKSTLLNALVGSAVAATDATECTRVVTWYQDGHVYRFDIESKAGRKTPGIFRDVDGQVSVDLGDHDPDDVSRIIVTWPSQALRQTTLIDSPGIGSLSSEVSERTLDFLTSAEDNTPADAVIYLMRHLHSQDVQLLQAFHDVDAAQPSPINAIAVLSRADEVGAGRPDAMESAAKVAGRLAKDPSIRRLAQTVIPVAGLLAETAATLTQSEFNDLSRLAELPVANLQRLLLSADSFSGTPIEVEVSSDTRAELFGRFGVFGLHVATEALRERRALTTASLAEELLQISGLTNLRTLLDTLFVGRARVLKSRSALQGLVSLVGDSEGIDVKDLAAQLERVLASDHSIAELRVLSEIRTGRIVAKQTVLDEMEQLIGAQGDGFSDRLGLARGASNEQLRSTAIESAERWRRLVENPLSSPSLVAAGSTIVRSCEGMVLAVESSS